MSEGNEECEKIMAHEKFSCERSFLNSDFDATVLYFDDVRIVALSLSRCMKMMFCCGSSLSQQ
jgi:hypothetical protein